MFRWQIWLGAAIGMIAAAALLATTRHAPESARASGPIISEFNGHLRELVIQYEPAAKSIVATAYRDFLGALETNVTVHVLCPDRAAFDDLAATVGKLHCQFLPILAGHPLTTWSRDRWVALTPDAHSTRATVLSPRAENAGAIWGSRAGDELAGQDIASALPSLAVARRSHLYFDGGDFFADNEKVFAMPRILARNIQHTVADRAELLAMLSAEFKHRVVMLGEAPDHHAAMFMASIGGRTMLVADPSLGRKFVPDNSPEFMSLPGGPDFTPETQRGFDAVAAQCATEGYRVARLPVIPAGDGKTFLTYVNVIMDQQGPRRIVYLPFYRGVEAMNASARAIWEGLGFEVRPVDCTETYRHFGCLHCLVNVLRRE